MSRVPFRSIVIGPHNGIEATAFLVVWGTAVFYGAVMAVRWLLGWPA